MAKTVPTIEMVLAKYPKFAAVERLRTGKPGERAVANTLIAVRRLCELGAMSLDEPVSVFTRKRLTHLLDCAGCAGLKPVTIWSYLSALKGLFGRWARAYYADLKWQTPVIELPTYNRLSPRYVRPDATALAKVKAWYNSLAGRDDAREWVVATLMLEFAMRNGDIEKLQWSDFRQRDGAVTLCYTPHKTALSSGRRVAWPVHPDIWAQLCAYRDSGQQFYKRHGWSKLEDRNAPLVVPCARDVLARLNADLRAQKLFTGSKGCYELRKICIDHIYQKFGAEMASSISGDDIRTVMRYYADPSQPNIGEVRVVDLL